jgi:AcrR family transcriptional regulator
LERHVRRENSNFDESDAVSHLQAGRRRSRGADTLLAKTDRGLKEALLALLARKPLDQISIREICSEAGIHYATFFRRNESKEELLDRLAADQVEQIVSLTVPMLGANNSHQGFVALFRYVHEHSALWTTLLTGGAAPTMRATLMGLSTQVSAEMHSVEGGLPLSLARSACVTVIIEAIAWWLVQPVGAYSTEQMADYVTKMLETMLPNN